MFNSTHTLVFLGLASTIIICAMATLSARSAINKIIGLISLFLVISIIILYINYTFLALTYLIVYIGAIAILFLFIIMMVPLNHSDHDNFREKLLIMISFFALGIIIGLSYKLYIFHYEEVNQFFHCKWHSVLKEWHNIQALAWALFLHYPSAIYLIS